MNAQFVGFWSGDYPQFGPSWADEITVHDLVADSLTTSVPVLGTPMLFDLEHILQTRVEFKSIGNTDFSTVSFGATHIYFNSYGNYEVNEFGE